MFNMSELESKILKVQESLDDSFLLENKNNNDDSYIVRYQAKDNFHNFYTSYIKYKNFITDYGLLKISEKLDKALLDIDNLLENKHSENNDRKQVIKNIIDIANEMPDPEKLEFEFNKKITTDDTNLLFNELLLNPGLIHYVDINKISSTMSREDIDTMIKNLIELHNMEYNYVTKDTKRLKEIFYFFDRLDPQNDLDLLKNEIEIAHQNLAKVKTQTSKQSNQTLSSAFKDEAKSVEKNIIIYNILIFITFLVLINKTSKIVNSALSNEVNLPSDNHFYYFYFSFVIIIAAFLSFILKQRVRLLDYHKYCRISHLEIEALSSYSAQLNDNKIDDLKIHLADRYFQGPNAYQQNTSNSQDSNLIISKINEISSTVENIKKNLT